jgi:hypothetical protein
MASDLSTTAMHDWDFILKEMWKSRDQFVHDSSSSRRRRTQATSASRSSCRHARDRVLEEASAAINVITRWPTTSSMNSRNIIDNYSQVVFRGSTIGLNILFFIRLERYLHTQPPNLKIPHLYDVKCPTSISSQSAECSSRLVEAHRVICQMYLYLLAFANQAFSKLIRFMLDMLDWLYAIEISRLRRINHVDGKRFEVINKVREVHYSQVEKDSLFYIHCDQGPWATPHRAF